MKIIIALYLHVKENHILMNSGLTNMATEIV